ncbi:hypothetical protein [Lysinibacillus sp. NPDC086135]|uniref:hypothetical protein n=1 Tax=Lysinibacillus sp. NPDC086135 TaxID=3364130 RepID=UPI0037F42EF0
MIKNFRLLYDIKKIKNSFSDVVSQDIYDYRTMENYVEENMDGLNLDELKIIHETVSEENKNIDAIKGFFITAITALLTVIAFGITALVTIITSFEGNDGIIFVKGILAYTLCGLILLYILLLSLYYFKKSKESKEILKLKETIKIIIAIKESKKTPI